jgi:hypothetical protein
MKKMKLYEFVKALMPEQKIIVIDYYNDKLYLRKNASSASYLLEYNEELRDSNIHLIEIDIYNSAIIIHVRKD